MNMMVENVANLNAIIGIYVIPIGSAILAGVLWLILHIVYKGKKGKKNRDTKF